ncbi:hypothetical protein H9Q69_013660 [Fusarium xylarioides]|nr:hypothetical protein H9Q69_013660 [Fusarium xylarioides]
MGLVNPLCPRLACRDFTLARLGGSRPSSRKELCGVHHRLRQDNGTKVIYLDLRGAFIRLARYSWMNYLKRKCVGEVILDEVTRELPNELIIQIVCGDGRRTLGKLERNQTVLFGDDFEDNSMDSSEIKGANWSSLVPFAGHDPKVRLEPDRVIRDEIMSMDQMEAEPPALVMAINDLHQFFDMIHIDMHPGLDARKTVVPSRMSARSACQPSSA